MDAHDARRLGLPSTSNTGSGATGATSGLPLPSEQILGVQPLGLPGATSGLRVPTEQILGIQTLSGLPLPTEQILGIQALRLLGLPRGYMCQPSKSLEYTLWGYWSYLGATFAN